MKTLPPLQIGSVKIDFPIMLAPMAGYTDSAFRCVCRRYGAGAVYTEVANAISMRMGAKPTLHLLETAEEERPAAAHIYGSEADVIADAAKIAEDMGKFDYIDINCGCPVRKIVRKGSGAALMKTPSKIGDIVTAVRNAVSIPVTVKTRIGMTPETINIEEIARIVEDCGASALAIHARPATQGHTGDVQWDQILKIKDMLSIPVIGNGGIYTAEEALEAMDTGVDGIMIAKGAVGKPWIFRQIHELLAGKEITIPTLPEKKELILNQLDHLIELKAMEAKHRRKKVTPEQSGVLHFRAQLHRYLKGSPRFNEVKVKLQFLMTRDAVIDAINLAHNL